MINSQGVSEVDGLPRDGKSLHSPRSTIDTSSSDITNQGVSSPRGRLRSLHKKPKIKSIGQEESTTSVTPPPRYSPSKSRKLETLASALVKNIFNKRLLMKRQSSIDSRTRLYTSSDTILQQTYQQDESLNNDFSSPMHSQHIAAEATSDIPKSPFPELLLSTTTSSEITSPKVKNRLTQTLVDACREDSSGMDNPPYYTSPHVSPFPDMLLSSDVSQPYQNDKSSPSMRRRIRTNLDALYSLYSCSRQPQSFEVDSLVGSDDDNIWNDPDTLQSPHYHPSSCTYNFLPLSWFTACSSDGLKRVDDMTAEFNGSMKSVLSSDNSIVSDVYSPVLLHSSRELANFPSILSDQQILQLRNDGLPPTVKLMSWVRAYSLRRDGDSFDYMVKKLADFTQTLVVIQTTHGDILGGYSDIPWIRNNGGDYDGGGRVFLFASNPAMNSDAVVVDKNNLSAAPLQLYHWNGKNNTLRMSSMNRGCFGMGDGDGAFGWFVQNDFTSGITGPCESFQSPALTPDLDGIFIVKDIEVWGFLPMLTAFHQSRYHLIHGLKKSPFFSPSEVSLPNVVNR